MESRKQHWENVYATRQPHEVSWTQETPAASLAFIHSFNLPKNAAIIDIGGGDSRLVDHLLEEGYTNLSVLDISEKALERAQKRLGERASQVKWIAADVTQFQPETAYDVWHDRAAFHFMNTTAEVDAYLSVAAKAVHSYLAIGTFSDKGPLKCSGLDVHRYSEEDIQQQLTRHFNKMKCITEDHVTPFQTTQNFLFCSFRRNDIN